MWGFKKQNKEKSREGGKIRFLTRENKQMVTGGTWGRGRGKEEVASENTLDVLSTE